MFGKLSPKEIDKALEKIRLEYDHFIVHYQKGTEAKTRFENRLSQGLRTRFDMTTFIGIEIQVVKELIAREDEALLQAELEAQRPKKPAKSYADFVIEKQQQQIKDYPAIELPPQASPDVAKLFGALDWFRHKIWSVVLPVLREKDPCVENLALEDEMAALTPYQGRLPKELDAYSVVLTSGGTLSQQAKAQNRCILLGAQHLHRLQDRLKTALEKKLTDREKELLTKTYNFVDKMIKDFRLKDLKPAGEPAK